MKEVMNYDYKLQNELLRVTLLFDNSIFLKPTYGYLDGQTENGRLYIWNKVFLVTELQLALRITKQLV